MDDTGKFNTRNPAVKRIMQEVREIQRDKSQLQDMMAQALEDNIFEWHFAVRGPPDSEFEGGIYHGRIIMPPDYPFKPPAFMLLTPNGRFETGVKICLSISAHHPEHWQPIWSVRTALTALIAFMPTPADGALGSLDFPKEERRRLALRSRKEAPKFGSEARQQVTQYVHEQMLATSAHPSVPQEALTGSSDVHTAAEPSTPECSDPPQNCAAANTASSQATETAAAVPSRQELSQGTDWEDRGLGILAAAISLAIMAILGRKALYIAGVDIYDFF